MVTAAITRVGVIGGGQLAQMLAIAAQKLNLEIIVQTPHPDDPAVESATEAILAPVDDLAATAQLAQQCQVITFENEFVDLEGLGQLQSEGVCFRPSLASLSPLLDKYDQRCFLAQIGLPVPHFAALSPNLDLAAAGFHFPLVVKSRRHGYDGQGTFILANAADLQAFWQNCPWSEANPTRSQAYLVEEFVPFERELAVMAARSLTGEMCTYPIMETQQKNQVCHWVFAAATIPAEIQSQIQTIATHLLTQLQTVGILGIELFLTPAGKVLVNEIAPRTHNSGHLTLEACPTSQFEQHLRAIAGLPLGDTQLLSAAAVMVNLLGFEHTQSDYAWKRQQLAAHPQTYVHWYGKNRSYPGRKLGHVTALLNSSQRSQALAVVEAIETLWYSPAVGQES